jgi:hypothetical protein
MLRIVSGSEKPSDLEPIRRKNKRNMLGCGEFFKTDQNNIDPGLWNFANMKAAMSLSSIASLRETGRWILSWPRIRIVYRRFACGKTGTGGH